MKVHVVAWMEEFGPCWEVFTTKELADAHIAKLEENPEIGWIENSESEIQEGISPNVTWEEKAQNYQGCGLHDRQYVRVSQMTREELIANVITLMDHCETMEITAERYSAWRSLDLRAKDGSPSK